jgi:hypothetical protein
MSPPDDMERAGEDFDQLFDWGSATSGVDSSMLDVKVTQAPVLPISPLSATHHDFNFTIQPQSLTAPSIHDLPTPRHSSSSPETRPSTDLRLSGETLRDNISPTNGRPLKRKLSPNDNIGLVPQREVPPPAAKKRPHNIIEKRYRANLNEKIAELRDSVPSLRSSKRSKARDGSGPESDDEDLDGLTPSNKLNKASVLTKAVEYIKHLEFRTRRLEDENRALKDRVETLDKVIAQGGHDSERATAFTSESIIEGGSPAPEVKDEATSEDQASKPAKPVQGLIPIPDSWRRLRQNQSQEHYGHVYESRSQSSVLKGKWPKRIMLGSLAGLMVVEGFSEHESSTESTQKGLFGIPLELLDGWEFLRSPRLYLAAFGEFCRAGGVLPLAKGFFALTIACFLIFAYLFNSKPPPKDDMEEDGVCAEQAPGPASPIEVRRRAWSTSMQVLQLPHHSFFPEWLAVTVEWLNYTVRYLFGYQAYFWLTGRSSEDDAARIKAWDIAIDAQLAGGDVEVSRSRVVLTSFGSGTLPRTPMRLMQKALHCRVLLWNVGRKYGASFHIANSVGRYFANREWQRAKYLQERTSPRDTERLPSNLAALLAMDCEDVFTDTVIQRAYNLMYDRRTHDQAEDVLMDVVVEDHAVRSPMDAVAAWRSSAALRSAFEMSLRSPSEVGILQDTLSLALRIAPNGSAAQVRALAAHALYGTANRNAYYLRATEILRPHTSSSGSSHYMNAPGPFFIDSSTPASARADIENCLHCAKALITLDQEKDVTSARQTFASKPVVNNKTTTILTVAAVRHVLARLPLSSSSSECSGQDSGVDFDADSQVGSFISRANSPVADCHSSPRRSLSLVWSSSQIQMPVQLWGKRRQSMVSNDTGYESLDESVGEAWGIESV